MKKLFLFVVTIFLINCSQREDHQEPESLPPITQTGANTAGVIIDGIIVIPKDGTNQSYGGPSIIKGLSITLGNNFVESNGNSSFSLMIKNVPKKDGYFFSMNIGILNRDGDYFTEDQPACPEIYVGKLSNGTVIKQFYAKKNSCKIAITKLDFIQGIISGTFSGDVFDENGNKISLAEGRFDIKINV